MNFETGESKIYFKPINSDEDYKELGEVKEMKIENNKKTIKNDFIDISKKADSLNIELKKDSFNAIKKMLGYSNLKSKRFKKLLMSVGFGRNEAEKINNFFKYNSVPRYEYYIQEYSEEIELIKKILKVYRRLKCVNIHKNIPYIKAINC